VLPVRGLLAAWALGAALLMLAAAWRYRRRLEARRINGPVRVWLGGLRRDATVLAVAMALALGGAVWPSPAADQVLLAWLCGLGAYVGTARLRQLRRQETAAYDDARRRARGRTDGET
jgi:hypothetical protein